MAMDGILFCAYRLIFMVTSLTICNRFSFKISDECQRIKVNLQPSMQIFHPGSVYRRMSLDRKLTIFR